MWRRKLAVISFTHADLTDFWGRLTDHVAKQTTYEASIREVSNPSPYSHSSLPVSTLIHKATLVHKAKAAGTQICQKLFVSGLVVSPNVWLLLRSILVSANAVSSDFALFMPWPQLIAARYVEPWIAGSMF